MDDYQCHVELCIADLILLTIKNLSFPLIFETKTSYRYERAFAVTERIEKAAGYLPTHLHWLLHNRFHIDLLKKCHDFQHVPSTYPVPPPGVFITMEVEYSVAAFIKDVLQNRRALFLNWKRENI